MRLNNLKNPTLSSLYGYCEAPHIIPTMAFAYGLPQPENLHNHKTGLHLMSDLFLPSL